MSTAHPDRRYGNLRQRAEEHLTKSAGAVTDMPTEDLQRLVHELQVHQVELEMQNEELRRTQNELATTRDRYADLYDFAPVGYMTLDASSMIVEANLTAANMLGIPRTLVVGKRLVRFIQPPDRDAFHKHCREAQTTKRRQTCEVEISASGGIDVFVRMETIAIDPEPDRRGVWRTALIDVTERNQAQKALRRAQEDQKKPAP
jgi:PAS domain S-box-containing protein